MKFPHLLFLLLFLSTSAVDLFAAAVEGDVICVEGPSPPASVVIAVSMETGQLAANVLSDAQGHYRIEGLSAGDYQMMAIPFAGGTEEGYTRHQYTLQPKFLRLFAVDAVLDFETRAAYQVILEGEIGGSVADQSEYRHLFVSDENDNALPLTVIGADNAGLGVSAPSFNLPLGTRARFHFLWELPRAGKIMVMLDDQGRGYAAESQGTSILRVDSALAHAVERRLEAAIAATDADVDVEEAPARLAEVRAHIDQAAYDEAAGLGITALEELALSEARAGIERFRKGDLSVVVLDARGNPVPEARVTALQERRDFKFGFFGNYADLGEAAFRQALADGFDFFTAGVYWSLSEPQDDDFRWTLLDETVGMAHLPGLGYALKGHPLLYFMDMVMPDYTKSLGEEALLTEIDEHVRELAQHYAGQVDCWDIINEAHGYAASWGMSRERITQITRNAVDRVHATDPAARTLVNSAFDWYGQSLSTELALPDHDTLFSLSIPAYIADLRAEAVDFDIIGQQLYNGGCITLFSELGQPPGDVPTFDLATISDMLDTLSGFDRPIHVTEQAVPSAMAAECPGMSYWREPWSPSVQADYLEAVYTLAFGKESVEAVSWWDLSDEGSFIQDGGLLTAQLVPKPAYERFAALAAQWTSDEAADTGNDGRATFRVFGGDYRIRARLGEHEAETTTPVSERESRTVELVLVDYLPPVDGDDETGAEVDPDADMDDEAFAEADPDADMDNEVFAEADPDTDMDDEAFVEADPDADMDGEAFAESDPDADMDDEAFAEADPDADMDDEAFAEADPDADMDDEAFTEAEDGDPDGDTHESGGDSNGEADGDSEETSASRSGDAGGSGCSSGAGRGEAGVWLSMLALLFLRRKRMSAG